MNPDVPRSALIERSFGAAAILAAIGALGPVVVGAGHSNRVEGAFFPMALAAVAMAVLAVMYQRGRGFGAVVYLVGGLALAYGLLFVLYVPVRLTIEGVCPPGTAQCPVGFEPPLTSAEGLGINIAVLLGVGSWLAGSLGLIALYRQRGHRVAPPAAQVWPDKPPVAAAKPKDAPTVAADSTVDAPESTAKPEAKPEPEPGAEPSTDSKPSPNPPAN